LEKATHNLLSPAYLPGTTGYLLDIYILFRHLAASLYILLNKNNYFSLIYRAIRTMNAKYPNAKVVRTI
jgi:hypothetical protein